MAAHEKPEVYLEVGCGFLRIPTEAVNYNITLLPQPRPCPPTAGSTPPPPPAPCRAEPPTAEDPLPEPVPAKPAAAAGEPFHEQVCAQTYNELNRLAEELELTMAASTPDQEEENDRELETRLRGAARHARELTAAIAALRQQAELAAHPPEASTDQGPAPELAQLRQQLAAALELTGTIAPPAPAAPPPRPRTKILRYPFELDTVFQTIYELCTNETVKTHISGARAKAGTIFTKELFWREISPKVGGYPVDDGFINVPMSDMFPALAAACSEKAIINLFKKMDAGQSSIFLDQSLPLELPPPEELEEEGEAPAPRAPDQVEPPPQLAELQALLATALESLTQLEQGPSQPPPAPAENEAWEEGVAQAAVAEVMIRELEAEIETIASLLPELAAKPPGLELLSESHRKLQALAITLGSQLRQRQESTEIGFLPSLKIAQEEAENYLTQQRQGEAPEPSPLDIPQEPDELDQLEGFAELAELEGTEALEDPPGEMTPEPVLAPEEELDPDLGLALAEDGEFDLDSAPEEESPLLAAAGMDSILGELAELEALDLPHEPAPVAKSKPDLAEQNDIDKLLAEMGM